MSNALKSAAETTVQTVHAFSDLVEDLVEGARDRIEELPPLAKSRRARRGFPWPLVAVAVAIAALAVAMKRLRRNTGETPSRDETSSGSGRVGERTLAVS